MRKLAPLPPRCGPNGGGGGGETGENVGVRAQDPVLSRQREAPAMPLPNGWWTKIYSFAVPGPTPATGVGTELSEYTSTPSSENTNIEI
jgi:hypothetical protein